MESARRCLVAVLARGTNSWQRNEGLAVQVDQIPVYRARRGNQRHYQEGSAIPKHCLMQYYYLLKINLIIYIGAKLGLPRPVSGTMSFDKYVILLLLFPRCS